MQRFQGTRAPFHRKAEHKGKRREIPRKDDETNVRRGIPMKSTTTKGLHSTENHTQHSVITHKGKECEYKRTDIIDTERITESLGFTPESGSYKSAILPFLKCMT